MTHAPRLETVAVIAKMQAVLVSLIGAAFVLSVFQCREAHPLVEQRPARWPEYESFLREQAGPIQYQGGVQINYGGCDVYRGQGDDWWLVGPGRRFTRCTKESLVETGDRVILDEYRRRTGSQ